MSEQSLCRQIQYRVTHSWLPKRFLQVVFVHVGCSSVASGTVLKHLSLCIFSSDSCSVYYFGTLPR